MENNHPLDVRAASPNPNTRKGFIVAGVVCALALLGMISARKDGAKAAAEATTTTQAPSSTSPSLPALKIGEDAVVAAGSFIFSDLAARDEFNAAQAAKDSTKLAALDVSNRAWTSSTETIDRITKTEGVGGLVELRGWLKNNQRIAYLTEPKNVTMLPPPPKFKVGQEVEITANAPLYTNRDLVLALRRAHNEDDAAKFQELAPQLDADTMLPASNTRAKVVEADIENALYKVEGKQPDGSLLRRWAKARSMESYLSPEDKKFRADLDAQRVASERLPEVKAKIEGLMKETFRGRLRKVEVNAQPGGKHFVAVDFNIDDNLTAAMVKKGAEMKMEGAYRVLFTTAGLDVRSVVLTGFQKLMDAYGKETEDRTYRTEMDDETAAKIVWKNSASLDFTQLWHTSFLHRGLRE